MAELSSRQIERIADDVVEEVCDTLDIEDEGEWAKVNESLGSELIQVLESWERR